MITEIAQPVRTAVIGAGCRSSQIYQPILSNISQWIDVVAVCDPVKEHADEMAQSLGAKAFYDIHELVKNDEIEAALVISPVDSHHSISVFLSEHKIHNMVETTWCNTLRQAREMIHTAQSNGVLTVVAENFFRFAVDRFSNAVRESGYIGKIHRIFSYNDHTGYHNNSRWIHFAKAYPEWVQSVTHTMPTMPFTAPPARGYNDETYRCRFLAFPDDFMVIDSASNIKGFLGRLCRPGFTEWQGETGTLVHTGVGNWQWETKINRVYEDIHFPTVSPVVYETPGDRFVKAYADTPQGRIEYINPFVPQKTCKHINLPFYGCAIMDELIDFALAVRGVKEFEYSAQDAMMSLVIELACEESAAQQGKRIDIGADMNFDVEAKAEERLRQEYGADPYDVENMLRISYPRK